MISAGLDVGSRTIKMVTFDTIVRDSIVVETGANPLRRCQELMSGRDYERLVVTGYGRHLIAPQWHSEVISEIRAFAVGARYLYPDCGTVIDIGGQDCKVILLSDNGEVQKFEMNDRCAAGTGKFLEIMANTLDVKISELGNLAMSSPRAVHINSLCMVFAESEVVSLIARGEQTNAIALGLHDAIATRIGTMARRVGIKERVVFAGGAALNQCLNRLVGDKLNIEMTVPREPQIVGAIGAALLATKMLSNNNEGKIKK